ncbi:delta-60 repeat domain-containing protein [Pseudomonas sp. H11T01]|uniref:delta-60 repeat domain-containing protein n=1 Tax=Pseudomonas sp. H11T01 TaxID=3402749 RepID=UPI003AD3008E
MTTDKTLTPRAAGDLDPGFGAQHDGKVILSLPNARDTSGECIAEGPDGRIYVGGAVDAEGDELIHKAGLACLRKDGTPAPEFGNDGFVIVPFAPTQDAHVRQILFLKHEGEDKILLCSVNTKNGESLLARLHADGRLDNSFGDNGRLTIKLPSTLAQSLGLGPEQVVTASDSGSGHCTLADGKIYVVTEIYMPIWIAKVAVLIRLNSDGSFDTSFNKTGYVAVTNQHWGNSIINDVLVRNGKITVCGTLKGNGMVARLNDDGTFDEEFAINGFALLAGSELTFEKLTQHSEKGVLAAGWGLSPRHGVLACFTENGQLDPTFNGGKVLFQSFGEGSNVLLYGVGQAHGKIIVSGRMGSTGGLPSFVVARYLIDGTLDLDFGHGKGWSSTQFENHYTIANAMALQKDGKVLVVGNSGPFSNAALIARFLNDTQE